VSKKTAKNRTVSTELFTDRVIPDLIKKHELFSKPVEVKKIFRSIGLPNFKDTVKIEKQLVDIRKDGSFVFNLLKSACDVVNMTKDAVSHLADKLQYLESTQVRETNRDVISRLHTLSGVLTKIPSQIDPHNGYPFEEGVVANEQGKVILKLGQNIADESGKVVFKKNEGLFKVLNKIRESATELGAAVPSIETTTAFQVFGKENVPNREYFVVFSSEGKDGAWDIATMSMRGIRSCQRWDGEYPTCLIGSILSKFIGVIYLTSGAEVDDYRDEKTGAIYKKLGSKMMRRCVVRYAIDADEKQPCILIDKMYPDPPEKEILVAFTNAIKSRVKIPVHYAPDLGNRLKHIYLPHEEIREGVSDRYWSYQDSPIKSKQDIDAYILNFGKDEIDREIKAFRANLALYLARNVEMVFTEETTEHPEVRKTINNIRMNTLFTPFCDQIVSYVLSSFKAPVKNHYNSSKAYYRKYLMDMLAQRKTIFAASKTSIVQYTKTNTSRVFDGDIFTSYINKLITEFVKNEVKKLIV
jgi:hypothetical protein